MTPSVNHRPALLRVRKVAGALLVLTLLLDVISAAPRVSNRQRSRDLAASDRGNSQRGIHKVYEFCTDGQDSEQVLECVTDALEKNIRDGQYDFHSWLTILSSALIFFLQAGFAMLCAGCVRIKNVGNTMLKNLLDACGAALGFFTIGYAFAYGGQYETTATTFVGTSNFFMTGVDDLDFWLFQFAFAATSATIVAGTLAERCQMAAYLCYSIILTGFVYPVVAHAIWSNNGFLSPFNVDPFLGIGVIDFAGSGVVHITGGSTALFATMILGPRKGRFYDARGNPLPKPKPFPGHSVALQMLGTFILWFGWYGFNPGSALHLTTTAYTGQIAALAAVNTTLCAASSATSALFTKLFIEERTTGEANFDLQMLMNGAIAGLVASTAGCAVIQPWAAVIVGVIAGWLYMGFSALLLKVRIDDAVDAIPVHLACGMWGLISVALFAHPDHLYNAYGNNEHSGLFYSSGPLDATLLGVQLICILFISCWIFFLMFPFFVWLNYMGWLRSDSLEELVGLDISYHGGSGLHNDDVKEEYIEAYRQKKGRGKHLEHAPYGEDTVQENYGDQDAYDENGVPYDNGHVDEHGQPYEQDPMYGQDQDYYQDEVYDPNQPYEQDINGGYIDHGQPGGYDRNTYQPDYDNQDFPPESPSYHQAEVPLSYRQPENGIHGLPNGLPPSFRR